MISAQIPEQACCINKQELKDCCTSEKKQEEPCHNDSEKNSCGDDCTKCKTCNASTVLYASIPSEKRTDARGFRPLKKEKFNYLTPGFSNPSAAIWQPPKIN